MLINNIKITNNFILVTLENQEKYKISDEDYFELNIKANDFLDEKKLLKLKEVSNIHTGYLYILNRLKYKDLSEYQVYSLLKEKYNLDDRNSFILIDKLKRYQFIDDKRYTKDLIKNNEIKLYGYNRVKENLKKVNINDKIIEEFLIFDFNFQFELALEYGEKVARTLKNMNHYKIKTRIYNRLLYQGFSNDVALAVIDKLNIKVSKTEEQRLLKNDIEKHYKRLKRRHEGYQLKEKLIGYLIRQGYKYDLIKNTFLEMELFDE